MITFNTILRIGKPSQQKKNTILILRDIPNISQLCNSYAYGYEGSYPASYDLPTVKLNAHIKYSQIALLLKIHNDEYSHIHELHIRILPG